MLTKSKLMRGSDWSRARHISKRMNPAKMKSSFEHAEEWIQEVIQETFDDKTRYFFHPLQVEKPRDKTAIRIDLNDTFDQAIGIASCCFFLLMFFFLGSETVAAVYYSLFLSVSLFLLPPPPSSSLLLLISLRALLLILLHFPFPCVPAMLFADKKQMMELE